jgi:uncharacterized radical SAM superfamily Fe-S cluster-containing enzyme
MTIHEQKAETIIKYSNKYGLDTMIETGTYYGDMVESQRNNFKKIISIELGDGLAKKAQERFDAYPHIKILQGDSAEVIMQLLPRDRTLFWLDAHCSGNDTAGSDEDNPLIHELEALVKDKNHVILIDDIHDKRQDLEDIVEGMIVSYEPGIMVLEPREISNVNFSITTACNRSCRNCSYNAPNKSVKHLTEQEIRHAAPYFSGCSITITGGEPTIHPKFLELVPKFEEIFGRKVSIETNGYMLKKHPDIFRHFKNIHIANYIKGDYFTAKEDNTAVIKWFVKNYPDINVCVDEMRSHRDRNTWGKRICPAGTAITIAYMGGLVYPCCIGDGHMGAIGIGLDGWRDKIRNTPLNCHKCFFSL